MAALLKKAAQIVEIAKKTAPRLVFSICARAYLVFQRPSAVAAANPPLNAWGTRNSVQGYR